MGCDPTPLAGGGRISEGNHGPFTHCSTADWGLGRGWNKSDNAATHILCKTGDRARGGTSWTTPRPISCAMTSKVRVVDGWWTEKAFRGRLGKSGWEGIGSRRGWEMGLIWVLSPVCWTPQNPCNWLNLARSRAVPSLLEMLLGTPPATVEVESIHTPLL